VILVLYSTITSDPENAINGSLLKGQSAAIFRKEVSTLDPEAD
jgi:hypothetical protein